MGRLIVDADVCIDMLRGHEAATDFFADNRSDIALSVATLTELLAGFRNDKEHRLILNTVSYLQRIPIDEEIAIAAGYFRYRFGKSHGTGIMDCLIAATADVHGLQLVTLNKKHYPMVKNIRVPYRKH